MNGALAGRSVLAIAAGSYHSLALASVLPIDTWTTNVFGPNANVPGIAGKFANPDGDGFINFLEYAFGTDPLNPNSGPVLAPSFNAGLLTMTYSESVAATDVEVVIEESFNLGTWLEAPAIKRILSEDSMIRIIEAGVPISPGEKQFMRGTVIGGIDIVVKKKPSGSGK